MNLTAGQLAICRSQRRMLEGLLRRLRPHWRRDAALPRRIEDLLRRDRRCGARDRRLYRELIYTALRNLPRVEAHLDAPERAAALIARLAPETAATRLFRAAFATEAPDEPGGAPEPFPAWFAAECPEAFAAPLRDVLNSRAPLWLRLQTDDPDPVFAEFNARGWAWRPSRLLPSAVELLDETDVTATEAYRAGRVEIQDLGSQLILEAVGPEAGGRWLDACAGAGGKSLQLARLLGPSGRVEAHDVRPGALAELVRRSERAGLSGRIARQPAPGAGYDGVLVDAPCSGSGTWRRQPHLKWVTTPAKVKACARVQLGLLTRFAGLVRPGGRLVYATCSLCRSENEDVLAAFVAAHPSFAPARWARNFTGMPRGGGLLFRPDGHDGDGFFAASLRRTA